MRDTQPGGITRPDERRVVVTRLLDAPRELVWRAWTETEHLGRWWYPAGWSVGDTTIELRAGGAFHHVVRSPDGVAYRCSATFREVVRPERIFYEGTLDDRNAGGAGMPPGAEVIVTFAEEDGRTRLTVETRFKTVEAASAADATGYATHWARGLVQLADYLRAEGR